MDKSQDFPDIPGAKEYYCEAIKPSEMITKAYEVMEMQFFAAYGGCTRGYSSEKVVATCDSKEIAEEIAKKKMSDRGIGAPFYYSVREAK